MRSGEGHIWIDGHGPHAVFKELSSSYPLKLLSPRTDGRIAVVYVLTYGGGLVSGDRITLSVTVSDGCTLVLLSQGSTKVFKDRAGSRMAGPSRNELSDSGVGKTMHKLVANIAPQGSLFLLPDPVTCFRNASYDQIQKIQMSSKNESLILLDWLTSGRRALGEAWALTRYYSVNEVVVGEKIVVRDVMLLTGDQTTRLAERLEPYSCYATLILCGPLVRTVLRDLEERYRAITVMASSAPPDFLWSFSRVDAEELECGVVRMAGRETEAVKNWLGVALGGVEEIIGRDVYRRTFG